MARSRLTVRDSRLKIKVAKATIFLIQCCPSVSARDMIQEALGLPNLVAVRMQTRGTGMDENVSIEMEQC